MGQGGGTAIEDAVSLAVLLPLGRQTEDIPGRLALYEQARRERIEMILKSTRFNYLDEGDVSAPDLPIARVLGMCFAHNEVKSSIALLQPQIVAV
ncbi:hypothetical protein EYZ11_004336 [Aspergillus tanneri]|nr:hypothetical protein EYZ11_004336 [Aspergillus tanneri]